MSASSTTTPWQAGLRYAVWEAATAGWSDEPVSGTEGGAGRFNALQTDATCGCPVAVAYDEVGERILVATREAGGWQIEEAATNVTGLTGLALELGFDARERPRIAFSAAGRAQFLTQAGGVWRLETIAEGLGNTGSVGLALDGRAHLAYADSLAGAQYVLRTATLDFDLAAPGTPVQADGGYNPLTPCPLIVTFYFDGAERRPAPAGSGPVAPLPGWRPLEDGGIYAGMAGVFGASAAGQRYIDLYTAHAAEMGRIGLDDPGLLWDAFGALQNFLPGLEALVTGRGDQVLVTQEMVDDALGIWTRLAAAAGPTLAGVIQGELAQHDQLGDFVGLTFADWARAIGVEPPGYVVYGPAVWR